MRIEAQLQPEDHVKAHRVHRRMSPTARLVFIALPVAWCLHALWRLWDMRQYVLFSYGMGGVALLTAIRLVYRFCVRRRLLKRHAADAPMSIGIGIEGIVLVTRHGSESLPWLRFSKYKCGKELVLLYRVEGDYLIFPDRWFSPVQKAEFTAYLRNELDEPAR